MYAIRSYYDDKNISEIPWRFQIDSATLRLRDSLYVESLDFDFNSYNFV